MWHKRVQITPGARFNTKSTRKYTTDSGWNSLNENKPALRFIEDIHRGYQNRNIRKPAFSTFILESRVSLWTEDSPRNLNRISQKEGNKAQTKDCSLWIWGAQATSPFMKIFVPVGDDISPTKPSFFWGEGHQDREAWPSRHEHEKSVRQLKEFLLKTLLNRLHKTIQDENLSVKIVVKLASTSKFPSQCRS